MKTLEVGFTCPKCRQERSGVDAIIEGDAKEPTTCAQCEQEFDEQPAGCVDCGKKIEDAWETRNRCYSCHDKFMEHKAEEASSDHLKDTLADIASAIRFHVENSEGGVR